MHKLCQGVCLAATLLWAATATAEEPAAHIDPDDPVTLSMLDAYSTEPVYLSRWPSVFNAEAEDALSSWRPISSDFNFQDSSAFARVTRLRSLSLLTLAEMGEGRLFLGVNDDGIVGLHFNADAKVSDGRYLEAARMPYLEDEPADMTAEDSGE